MLCIFYQAVIISILHLRCIAAQTPEQNDISRKLGCQLASVYQHANASANFSIPAVDIDGAEGSAQNDPVTITKSASSWTVTNILGQSKDAYAPDQHNILEQAIFLDTSSTIKNMSSAANAGLVGCAFFFRLPFSNLGEKDDGSCTTVFDDKCVKDFTEVADKASTQGTNGTYGNNLTTADACGHIAEAISDLPASCIKYKKKGSNGLGEGLISYTPLDFRPPATRSSYNCSDTNYPLTNTSIPANFYLQSTPMENSTNYTIYDQWSRTITPTLLTFMSNSSSSHPNTKPFSFNQLVCSSPRNVEASSRTAPDTSSDAEQMFGKIDIGQVVVWALVVNAFVFWML